MLIGRCNCNVVGETCGDDSPFTGFSCNMIFFIDARFSVSGVSHTVFSAECSGNCETGDPSATDASSENEMISISVIYLVSY